MKRILVIEDDEDFLQEISEMLHYNGYQVTCAKDGAKGLDEAIKNNPHLVLCDIMMPDMDGYKVLEKLHAKHQDEIIPFIFITALCDRQNFRRGMNLGADDYLTKPFSREELLNAIEARLKTAKRTEQVIQDKIEKVEKDLYQRLKKEKENHQHPVDSSSSSSEGAESMNKAQLMHETMQVIENNKIIDELKNQIYTELESKCSHDQQQLLKKLEKKIVSPNFLWDNITLFELQVKRVFPCFFEKIEQHHAGLTRYEKVFLAATFLELDTNQIAGLLLVSPGSVRKSRYRLKKKLMLKDDDSFYDYVKSFC